MKRFHLLRVFFIKRKAETPTEAEEDSLWEMALPGDHTPQTLLDTILFYNGYYFGLRSGKELQQWRQNPCQIQAVKHPGERTQRTYPRTIQEG